MQVNRRVLIFDIDTSRFGLIRGTSRRGTMSRFPRKKLAHCADGFVLELQFNHEGFAHFVFPLQGIMVNVKPLSKRAYDTTR